ncbi:GNAT family N-acetyltransferase [Salinibacterium sp. SYSU T00001]|uniref:GNAT family N-acetyltransferase n=1 Tax=Homoserinimonas sedimenticola TaxID=2986805 RepID=UPI0022354BD4|nr:GNAT family N-acetyltransferase [Salinibacterium sedimenticola]MCW4385527.1 GNAT family N-acetyltransferase [Salinibacterium sedimenticola]
MTAVPSSPVTLTPATPDDDAFINRVIAASRADDFAALEAELRERMLALQVAAQRRHYRAAHPTASDHIIDCAGRPVGRALLAAASDSITVVDIAVVPERRGEGIGTAAMRAISERGDRLGVPLQVRVWASDERLLRWYSRLGFVAGAASSTHVELVRAARAVVAA